MKQRKTHWLREFERSVPTSASFVSAMDVQLKEQFHREVGMEIKRRFLLMPPMPEPFRISNQGGRTLMDANLLCSRLAFPVRLSWSRVSGVKPVSTSDEVEETDIEFRWEILPVSAIIEAEKPPSDMLGDPPLPFPVSSEPISGPHVRLTFEMRRSMDAEERASLQAVFGKAQEMWNDSPNHGGLIHAVGKLEEVDSRHYAIDIDIGSAGRSGLRFMVDEAAKSPVKIEALHIANY